MRPEQHDLGRLACSAGQAAACLLDHGLLDHEQTQYLDRAGGPVKWVPRSPRALTSARQ
jgi:hypothetical protein